MIKHCYSVVYILIFVTISCAKTDFYDDPYFSRVDTVYIDNDTIIESNNVNSNSHGLDFVNQDYGNGVSRLILMKLIF